MSTSLPVITDADELRAHPNPLLGWYQHFVGAHPERLLLTGHSHQGWPDAALTGLQQSFLDAAELVDDKWDRVDLATDTVRNHYGELLDVPGDQVRLGENTFELLARVLSALPLVDRPRIVTTAGEFHSARRLLGRLAEAGLEVVLEPVEPVATLVSRLAAAVDGSTCAVVVSAVMFGSGAVLGDLSLLQDAATSRGAALIVDTYHRVGPITGGLGAMGAPDAFALGGGYKYLQLGEGLGFLRVPPWAFGLRPVLTGWFAEFEARDAADRTGTTTRYPDGPQAFDGATFDPASAYRGAAIVAAQHAMGLTPAVMATRYRQQVDLLDQLWEARGAADPRTAREAVTRRPTVHPLNRPAATGSTPSSQLPRAGFLALDCGTVARAGTLVAALRREKVLVDSRFEVLRLGPAPYLSDADLEHGIDILDRVCRD